MINHLRLLLIFVFFFISKSSALKFVGANWKCTIESLNEVEKQCQDLNDMWSTLNDDEKDQIELCINPPYVYIDRVRRLLNDEIKVGSQNALDAVGPDRKNTGATTMSMLRSVGCDWVLLGHSDRRNNLGETNKLIASKVRAALDEGLRVTLTIGELKWQRKMGLALRTLRKQLGIVAEKVPQDAWDRVVVAYEPVWAIGHGSTPCSPQEAQRINASLRKFICDKFGPEAAKACRFTYTGSVNEVNAAQYSGLPDVDGFVVGRAGLDANKLKTIISTLLSNNGKRD
jgi:triosephosphate isomerase